jgi:hypothetical protein
MRNRIRRALRSVLAASAEQQKLRKSPEAGSRVRQVEGIIQQVDPVGREMPVVVDGVSIKFYVPLHCDISLNDEPARMRLLQPRDRARLAFSVEHGVSRALSITVSSTD